MNFRYGIMFGVRENYDGIGWIFGSFEEGVLVWMVLEIKIFA